MQKPIEIPRPFCAKCKKTVEHIEVFQDIHRQFIAIHYSCHGTKGSFAVSQQELMEMSSSTNLIDFIEHNRIHDA